MKQSCLNMWFVSWMETIIVVKTKACKSSIEAIRAIPGTPNHPQIWEKYGEKYLKVEEFQANYNCVHVCHMKMVNEEMFRKCVFLLAKCFKSLFCS